MSQNLTSAAVVIGTLRVKNLTHLFSPGFVTYCWPQMYFVPINRRTIMAADENSKTRFLQNHGVVVVGISHSPTTHVTSGVFNLVTVNMAAVSIRPLLELIKVVKLQV